MPFNNFDVSIELKEILKQKTLPPKEVLKLVAKYKMSKDETEKDNLRDELFNSVAKFIQKMAIRYSRRNPGLSSNDFFDAGTEGFLVGLEKFKHKKANFLTYVSHWIESKMRLCSMGQQILTIPKGDFYRKKEKISGVLNSSLIFIDKKFVQSEDGFSDRVNNLSDPKYKHFESDLLNSFDDKDDVDKLLKIINNKLTDRERGIIKAIYFKELNFGEYGRSIKKAPTNLRFVHAKLLLKLKKMMNSNKEIVPSLSAVKQNRGRIKSSEQNAKMAYVKRNVTEATRNKSSIKHQIISIEVMKQIKEKLLAGEVIKSIIQQFKISNASIHKLLNNELRYVKNAGLEFTKEEKEKIDNFIEQHKQEKLKKLSLRYQKHSIETMKNVKERLLKGDDRKDIMKDQGVSEAFIKRFLANELIYVKVAGLEFTQEEKEKIKEINKQTAIKNIRKMGLTKLGKSANI